MQRIAIVSEHASPLAQLGGADSGGQNVYVANVARALARQGHCVDVFTRLDDACLSGQMEWEDNVRVIHVPAGPACRLPKESLLPYMGQFAEFMQAYVREHAVQYDVIHANFFMSAMAALPLARETHTPLAVTFHALGKVRRLHQAHNDRFSDSRFSIEEEIVREADCIIAECPQDQHDLVNLYDADPARIRMVPCGHDPQELAPMDMRAARRVLGWEPDTFYLLQLGRMVPRKGIDNVIRALARLRRSYGVNARRAEPLLQCSRCIRNHALVRAVRHYADRSHGLPASRGGVGDRRHQVQRGGRQDRLSGTAKRRRCTGWPVGDTCWQPHACATDGTCGCTACAQFVHLVEGR